MLQVNTGQRRRGLVRATDVMERRLREVAERREPLAPRPAFQALSLVERRCACSRDHYVMAGHHHRDRRMTAGSIDFLEASLTYQPSRPAFSSLPDCVESTTACRRKTAHRNDAALIRHLDGSCQATSRGPLEKPALGRPSTPARSNDIGLFR